MPELPDITVYLEALEARILGKTLEGVRLASPFLVRTVDPPVQEAAGRTVVGLRRIGKRIVICLDPDLFLVLHLMIAGRLHWRAGAALRGKASLGAFDFADGSLVLTEAGSKRRASLHVVRGEQQLAELDPGGIEVVTSTVGDFRCALRREVHTLKRALTDPRIFSGIGNAYSDEILHRARLSPLRRTDQLDDDEIATLQRAVIDTLEDWIERLRREAAGEFPEGVTAFRKGMAVHGRYRLPCPDCGAAVARIVYAENETNYCPRCQTEGRVLADRALSRLLGKDWPRNLEDLEEMRGRRPATSKPE